MKPKIFFGIENQRLIDNYPKDNFWLNHIARLCTTIAFVIMMDVSLFAFSGEDPIEGKPWYHEVITKEAAGQCGFTPGAAANVAWNADYIDSYLYNPIWWVQGGPDRLKVFLANYDELAKLHFDDLFSAERVRKTWQRYLAGTIAGLLWAKEHNDYSGAQNIIGVSLHAIQDFYSHSSWVDVKDRRKRTWFDMTPEEQNRVAVYTGAFELPQQVGVHHHGKILPACSILKQSAVSELMDLACIAISPLSNTDICKTWKYCKNAEQFTPSVLGVQVPRNVLYYNPPGMALDSKWLSDIAVQVRGVRDASGIELFKNAKDLAKKSSVYWLKTLEDFMNHIGAHEFWRQVRSFSSTNTREQEYEEYNRFPYTFLSAGPYPPDQHTPEEEYYLRVRLKTSNDEGSGTDADIYLHADGKEFLLDYLPRVNPLIAYNDFETGDDQAYVVGPFQRVPGSITLENRSADADDVIIALGRGIVDALDDVISEIGDILLSIIGGHADFVGSKKLFWSYEDLRKIGSSPQEYPIYVDGGGEGKHKVYVSIKKVRESSTENWAEYSIRLERLECIEESDWDRGTFDDEPFVLALLVPHSGKLPIQRYQTEPFEDIDKGDKPPIDYSFETVRLDKDYGMLSVAISILEHDDESNEQREKLLTDFYGKVDEGTKKSRMDFVTALGTAIATDWKLEHVNVFTFSRGRTVHTGISIDKTVNKWIKGGKREKIQLDASTLRAPLSRQQTLYINNSQHQVVEIGTKNLPYSSFQEGANTVLNGGNVMIYPGQYSAVGTYSKQMTLHAPSGGVLLK